MLEEQRKDVPKEVSTEVQEAAKTSMAGIVHNTFKEATGNLHEQVPRRNHELGC